MTPTELFISVILPWVITGCYFVLAGVTVFFIPHLLRSFWRLSWVVKISLLVIVTAGVIVRFFFVPNIHRIYYDEDRYLSYAVTFARFGQAKSIIYATADKLVAGDPDQATRLTVPVLNAWALKTLGFEEKNIFIVAKIASSLQILLMFILAMQMLHNTRIALFAAAGMALLPNLVYWSPSAGLDSYFVFFALLSCVATAVYADKSEIKSGLLFVVSLFLLLCVRLEAFLFIPVLLALLLAIRKSHHRAILGKRDLVYYGLIFILIVVRAAASISVLGQKWCCAEGLPLEAFHPDYFMRNALPNFINLFTRIEFPFVITVGALVTLAQMKRAIVAILGTWIALYFLLYSTYYAGMFYSAEFSGSYGRYFLILIPPLLLLAGISVDQYVMFIQRQKISKRIIIGTCTTTFLILALLPTIQAYHHLITTSPYYNFVDVGPAKLHEFADLYFAPSVPQDAVVLTSLATTMLMTGRTTGLFGAFMQDEAIQALVVNELKNNKRVFATIPYQCQVFPDQCKEIQKIVYFIAMDTTPPHPEGVQIAEIKLR